jgi:[glutamine synthetase] adenylyltransferase / [glutamine synthetase]-adenylyl-L-tyrosine phosphorylase
VTRTSLERLLADAGIPLAERAGLAAEPVLAWLEAAPPAEVVAGLGAAADPPGALYALARLLDAGGGPPRPGLVAPLLRLIGGSPALAGVLVGEGAGWPLVLETVLEVSGRDAEAHHVALATTGLRDGVSRVDLQAGLRRYRKREVLRIGGRDLLGLASVDDTVREITALADGLVDAAVASVRARVVAEWGEAWAPGTAGRRPARFCILGMGKLGGEELNYSSDVDLVCVYDSDGEQAAGRTLAQFFCRVAEETARALRELTADGLCFRVDLRLRPGGAEGPVAVALPAALSYYETWGQTWERAVWLKARPVGGDRELGEALLAELVPFVYRRYLDFGTLEDLNAMKRKVDASLRAPEAATRDVKLGRGGIREVEFFVQAQQLVHGGKDARLRQRGTLPALTALATHGYVAPGLAAELAAAYRFLRDVEHKLQIVQEQQTQLLPTDPESLLALARRLGFREGDAVAAFRTALERQTGVVHGAFAALFHGAEEARRRDEQPELATLVDELEHEEQALWRLGRLAFRDLAAAYTDLRLLRDGPPHAPASPRRRRALATLAPALLAEIARSADPDRALHHMATFVSTVGARTSYLHLLLENPEIMRLLVRLFATSQFLSAFFLRHPELLDSLMRADLVRVMRTQADMAAELATRMAAASDLEAELDTIRRFRHEEFLRIGVHDIQGSLEREEVSRQLTGLAETCLEAALTIGRREVLRRAGLPADGPTDGLVVVGMGKLGSGELNYNSDLDLIFVYDAGDEAWWAGRAVAHEVFTRIAQRVLSGLQTPTREGIAYRIDTRLRPSGNQGPLVSSLEAFTAYHRGSAQLWERQALVKARPLAGSAAVASRFEAVVADFVYGHGLSGAEGGEIARMRERIERERGDGEGGVNIKTGRGGLIDVEFVVQMLQLRHGRAHARVRARATQAAIAALEAEGLLPAADARALADGYAFLRAVENRLRLERDEPVEAMDADPEALRALARRLGYGGDDATAVAALRADHERHREAIRAVYDRQFADAGT